MVKPPDIIHKNPYISTDTRRGPRPPSIYSDDALQEAPGRRRVGELMEDGVHIESPKAKSDEREGEGEELIDCIFLTKHETYYRVRVLRDGDFSVHTISATAAVVRTTNGQRPTSTHTR